MTSTRWQRSLTGLAAIWALYACDAPAERTERLLLDGVTLPQSPDTEPLPACRFPERQRRGEAMSGFFTGSTACQVFPATTANRVFSFYADALSRDGWRRAGGSGHVVEFTRDDRRLTLVGLPYDRPPEGQRLRRMVLVFKLPPVAPDGASAPARP